MNDNLWPRTLRQWVTQGYPKREGGGNGNTESNRVDGGAIAPGDHFEFDLYPVGGWYDLMPIRGVNEVVEETDEWQVERNGAGALLKRWKDKDGTPEHVDFEMTSRDIRERDYRPHLLDVDSDRVDVEGSREALQCGAEREKWTYYGTLFIWEQMCRSLGDLCMYESLVLDPGWIHDFNCAYTDHLNAHFKILLEEAGVPDGMWLYKDLGFKQRFFCFPKVLNELIFAYYKEVVDFFNSYGVKVLLHSCGFVEEALPLIQEASFDGLNSMEVAAGNGILKFAEDCGDRLVFIGGGRQKNHRVARQGIDTKGSHHIYARNESGRGQLPIQIRPIYLNQYELRRLQVSGGGLPGGSNVLNRHFRYLSRIAW